MEQYKCEGPACVYTTPDKHQIHHHHIVPKSAGGTNKKMNLVRLCPTCHHKVYIPGARHGIHSIKAKNYMILKGILSSTGGLVLEYETAIITGYTNCDTWRNGHIDWIIKNDN